jgi:hypothetical protein
MHGRRKGKWRTLDDLVGVTGRSRANARRALSDVGDQLHAEDVAGLE